MNFWDQHGIIFVIMMIIFPRLTLFFGTSIPFGILDWIGWIFLPRFVAAYYCTYYYGHTNPILTMLAWIVAICVTFGQSKTIKNSRS